MAEAISFENVGEYFKEQKRKQREENSIRNLPKDPFGCLREVNCIQYLPTVNKFICELRQDKEYINGKCSSGRCDEETLMRNHGNGKMCEFAVYEYLTSLGIDKVQKPDCTVYKGQMRGWDADLKGEKFTWEIRNHDISWDTVSWMFNGMDQKKLSNNGIKLVLTSSYRVDTPPEFRCFIRWIGDYSSVVPLLGEPEHYKYKGGLKNALYARDMIPLGFPLKS